MLFVSPVALKHFSNLVYVSSYQNYKSNSCCSTSPQSAVRRNSVPRWCFCCLNSGEAASPTAKFSSQRAILSASLSDFEVDEVNKLLEMAGEKQRNPQRFQRALQNSLVVVTARLISNGILVGLTRAITDGAYNATIVEVFTDRRLPKPEIIKRNMVERLIKEARSKIPDCGIAMIAPEEDVAIYEKLKFVANPRGIRVMGITTHEED